MLRPLRVWIHGLSLDIMQLLSLVISPLRLYKKRNKLTSDLRSLDYRSPLTFLCFKVDEFTHQKDLFHSPFTPH